MTITTISDTERELRAEIERLNKLADGNLISIECYMAQVADHVAFDAY